MAARRMWMVPAALLLAGSVLHAQGEPDARASDLATRLNLSLTQQSKMLERVRRELDQALRVDSKARDSLLRAASARLNELSLAIARTQAEADNGRVWVARSPERRTIEEALARAQAFGDVTRGLAGQLRSLSFRSVAMQPRGYLGVTLSGMQNTEVRDGKVFTLFRSPSLIESVDAGGPAARAGLEAGDTVLAFGKLTLPGAVPLADVLTPGERLPIKVRRDGRERTQTVLVGTRPADSFSATVMLGDAPDTTITCNVGGCTVQVTGAAAASRAQRVAVGQPAQVAAAAGPRSATMPTPPQPPAAPGAPTFVFRMADPWLSTDVSVAGATMTTITEELEDLTGVSEGVLVLRVARGTPASQSGLRGGDVITAAGDDEVDGVRSLQRAVQRASSRGDKQLPLTVRRQRREQTITLRW
jgi:hypothetical protein